MTRARALVPMVFCLALGLSAPAAFLEWAASASAATTAGFRPRVLGAMGLMPTVNSHGSYDTNQDLASEALTPVVYHGGPVMTGGVTVHTIFWAPSGYSFPGALADEPNTCMGFSATSCTYDELVRQFFNDVAAASGTTTNEFSALNQFGDGTTVGDTSPGEYSIAYTAPLTGSGGDAIDDTHSYPTSDQCASPNGVATCLTDAQIQTEINTVDGGATGFHDIWMVFLPPNVDECISPGACGTNAFGGYHSVMDLAGHQTIYAVIVDPSIEAEVSHGADPNGDPDAEAAIDAAGHETVEAMTDPEGTGWMDPNGFEVADKCEFGPQTGTPIGFQNNAPYNEAINGDNYLLQEMWSNQVTGGNGGGCVQSTSATSAGDGLPLPQINLTQFSHTITGDVNNPTSYGDTVTVDVYREDESGLQPADLVATAQAQSNATTGVWTVPLPNVSPGVPNAVGDDRDVITVDYSDAPNGSVQDATILTGSGGNPFTESGWTGWTDLDNGATVTNGGGSSPQVIVGPCFQTGVLTISGRSVSGTSDPNDLCNTQTDTADIPLSGGPLGLGSSDALTFTSNDNRAFSAPTSAFSGAFPGTIGTPNDPGALVSMTVPLGEPDSATSFANPLTDSVPTFAPTGFPTCGAILSLQSVECSGLIPGDTYTVADGSAQQSQVAASDPGFSDDGTIGIDTTLSLPVNRGDTVELTNSASRILTTLNVSNLRVDINGNESFITSGSCTAGEYFDAPLQSAPISDSAGDIDGTSASFTGAACPRDGDASFLPSNPIIQTDGDSGGFTETLVPEIEDTSPMEGETVDGGFTALAEAGVTSNDSVIPTDSTSSVSLSITPVGSNTPVYSPNPDNVDTPNGVTVPALPPGGYDATWVVTDANGDTRTVTTRFIEQSALEGAQGPQGPQGPAGAQGAQGPQGPQGPPGPKPKVTCTLEKHNKIKCTVSFPKKAKDTKGTIAAVITRGGRILALGHARLAHGSATLTMPELRAWNRGAWQITLVLSRPKKVATTQTMTVRVR